MSTMHRIPREMAERKAAHGKPCTNCGVCCYITKCPLAMQVYGGEKYERCPALGFDDNKKSFCGLTRLGPPAMNDAAALLIGAGTGCDCRIRTPQNGYQEEIPDQEFYDFLDRREIELRDKLKAAQKLWGKQ